MLIKIPIVMDTDNSYTDDMNLIIEDSPRNKCVRISLNTSKRVITVNIDQLTKAVNAIKAWKD